MIRLDDLISAIDCIVKIERSGDMFQVMIVDKDNTPLQNLENYNLQEGDVLTINGLGFKVTLEDSAMAPHNLILGSFNKELVSQPISVNLKRKMDLPKGG